MQISNNFKFRVLLGQLRFKTSEKKYVENPGKLSFISNKYHHFSW
jgi:hypothetical protein